MEIVVCKNDAKIALFFGICKVVFLVSYILLIYKYIKCEYVISQKLYVVKIVISRK